MKEQQQNEFGTFKIRIAKVMCELLNCECIARVDERGFMQFIFPYTDEVVNAYRQAKELTKVY